MKYKKKKMLDKDLVKRDKKNLEFKGALHEVDLLLDCIFKDEI